MTAPDIELARCQACGWRRVPLRLNGQIAGWKCPNCCDYEEIK